MFKRLLIPFVLVFASACLLLPGEAFSEPAPVAPVLAISKGHSGDFTVGTNGTYTITVTNTGGAPTSGTITVTDTLPNGLGFVSGTGTNWTCSASGQTVSCTNPGPIANGSPSTITLTVSVCAGPTVVNQASVSGGGAPNASSNFDSTTVSGANPVLTITKTDNRPFTVGTNGTYTITVTNNGTATCGTITVTDPLPAGLTFIVGTGTGWTCSAIGPAVTCTSTTPINGGGGTSMIALTVSVGVAALPSVSNTASVSGGGAATGASSTPDATTVNMTVKSGPAVYISTFDGQQILAVDGAVGTTVAIHTGASGFSPEDIIVGPDKRIYICDPQNNKIYRVRQDNTQFETIYNQNSISSLPAFPEGPSFNGSDLYFNTHFLQGTGTNGGVWKMAGIATLPSGGPFNAPTQAFDSTTPGEGTAFDKNGNLYVVERSPHRVLKSIAPYTSASDLIPPQCGECPLVLDKPIGIAVNSAGDIFVANSGTTLQNINHFGSNGTFIDTYASFSGKGLPVFLEFDALDRLYVVTVADEFAAGGEVWRIDPPGGETNLVFLVALSTLIPGVASDKAVGVGVAPTDFLTQHYSISGTPVKKQFAFSTTGDEVDITFPAILIAFDLTVFREEVPYALLALQLPTSGPNLHFPCAGYDSDHGTCVVYEEGVGSALDPLPPGDFTGPVDYQLFYTPNPLVPTSVPVLAHALDNSLQTPVDQYDENELTGFTLVTLISSLSDPTGMDGGSGGLSRHVALSAPLQGIFQSNAFFCAFNSPIPPGKTFLVGQTVPIKFTITTGPKCTGSFVNSASMHLSVLKQGDGFQVVQSSNSRDNNDVFSVIHTQYIFNLTTIGYTPGTYIVTIWTKDGNGVAPQATFFLLQ